VAAERLDVDDAEVVARMAWELLERSPRITALFCFTDWAAVAVLRMLYRKGVRVPDDIAVVGFDDEPWSKNLPVSLTTVAHPVDELCATAVSLLRDRLAGPDGPWQRIAVAPRLIVRESSVVEDASACEEEETGQAAVGEPRAS
jgi:LacI family transcriptional regulator